MVVDRRRDRDGNVVVIVWEIVYELYGLTDEEIGIVESAVTG